MTFVLVTGITFAITSSVASDSEKTSAVTPSLLGTKDKPYEVALTKDNKGPVDLVIKTGEYVQFNSKDGKEHQIVRGVATEEHGATSTGHESSKISSGVIKSDEGYLLQFNEVGKFEFHDNYNHHYTITIIVYDPNQSAEDTKLES